MTSSTPAQLVAEIDNNLPDAIPNQLLVGAIRTTLTDMVNLTFNYVNVVAFGAVGDGVADDTTSIQNAINTGQDIFIPPGTYLTTAPLVCSTKGQRILGSGRDRTIIIAASTWSGTGGIFSLTSGEEGAQISDLKITCTTPGLTNGISALGQPRFYLERLRITLCSTGIDTTGNSGGATMNVLEMWNTVHDIYIDGSEDTMQISQLRCDNFDDPGETYINHFGVVCGRCDGLQLSDSILICVNQLYLFQGSTGPTFGMVTNTDFDTFNGLIMSAGFLEVGASMFTGGSLAGYVVTSNISQTGGELTVNGCYFGNAYSAMVGITGGTLRLNGSLFQGAGNTNSFLEANGAVSSTVLIACNNEFERTTSVGGAYMITVANDGASLGQTTRATIVGNRCPVDGAGNYIQVVADDYHRVVYNCPGNWSIATPAATHGIYTPN